MGTGGAAGRSGARPGRTVLRALRALSSNPHRAIPHPGRWRCGRPPAVPTQRRCARPPLPLAPRGWAVSLLAWCGPCCPRRMPDFHRPQAATQPSSSTLCGDSICPCSMPTRRVHHPTVPRQQTSQVASQPTLLPQLSSWARQGGKAPALPSINAGRGAVGRALRLGARYRRQYQPA